MILAVILYVFFWIVLSIMLSEKLGNFIKDSQN